MKYIIIRTGTFADGKGTPSNQIAIQVEPDVFEVLRPRRDAGRLFLAGIPSPTSLGPLGPNDPCHLKQARVRLERVRRTGRTEPDCDECRVDGQRYCTLHQDEVLT